MIYDILSPLRSRRLSWYIKQLDPVVYFPLFENPGSVIFNQAPSYKGTNNGTLIGSFTNKTGQVGKCVELDGNDYFTISDNDTIEGLAKCTVQIMFKVDTMSAFYKLFFKSGVYDMGLNDGGTLFAELNGVGNIGTITNGESDDNAWHIFHLTYDGSSMKAYIDGTLKETLDGLSGSLGTSTDPLAIGRHQANGNEYFIGCMQHVALFSFDLSQTQITKIARITGII